jgi:hypothetical protein
MRRWIGLAALAGTLSAVAYVLAYRTVTQGPPPGEVPRSQARWQSEEHWLVASIARDLVEMARFAATGRAELTTDTDVEVRPGASRGIPLAVTATVVPGQRVTQEVALQTFVWDPAEYASLASRLLSAAGGALPSPPANPLDLDGLADDLADLQAEVVAEAGRRVSEALAARFGDPAAHDAAALALAAFALREDAGEYTDTRAALGRITAHLAFAHALRSGKAPAPNGRDARVALLVLAGRGSDALAALDGAAAEGGAGRQAWRRALRRRLLEDTRHETAPATRIERRELYRALVRTLDPDTALEDVRRLGLESGTDGWRLVSTRLSVQAGNLLLADAVDRELAEARAVHRIVIGRDVADSDLARALDAPPDRCVTPAGPRAIGWGLWAAFLQRHLINAVWITDYHWRSMLSMHDSADRLTSGYALRFGSLGLFPLIAVRIDLEAKRTPGRIDDLVALVATAPERVNPYQWWSMDVRMQRAGVPRSLPAVAPWFTAGAHRGTTHDAWGRYYACVLPQGAAAIRAYHALSPLDFDAAFARAALEYNDQPAVRELEQLFGPRMEYDVRALDRVATAAAADLRALGSILQRKCALVAGQCFAYAHYLVETGQDDRAAIAYRRGIDATADAIDAAHNARWLMNRLLDRGEIDSARALAEMAGATGSGDGLATLARFHERAGRPDAAEPILQAIVERYGSGHGEMLTALYYRNRRDPAYSRRFEEAARKVFPGGLERVDIASLPPAPRDGVVIAQTGGFARRNGLQVGDVVVALDGYRVQNTAQYSLIRLFTDDPTVSLVVFRPGGYREMKVRSASRMLGVQTGDYPLANRAP